MAAVIVGYARTPFAKYMGALATVPATVLGAHAIRAALERAGVQGDQVDRVLMGQVLQGGAGQGPARQAAVGGGIPLTVPGGDPQRRLPLGHGGGRAGRDAHRDRPGEDRRRGRHGVHDARAARLARLPARPPLRRRRVPRHHGPRRPLGRLRAHRDGRLHRGAQRRPPRDARGPGRLGRGVAPPARGRCGVPRGGDRAVHDQGPQGRHGALDRRRPPQGHHRRLAVEPRARLRQGRRHHRGQRLADHRRRGGGRARRRVDRRGARPHRDGPDPRLRLRRRARRLAALAALQRDPPGARHASAAPPTTSPPSRSTRRSPPSPSSPRASSASIPRS